MPAAGRRTGSAGDLQPHRLQAGIRLRCDGTVGLTAVGLQSCPCARRAGPTASGGNCAGRAGEQQREAGWQAWRIHPFRGRKCAGIQQSQRHGNAQPGSLYINSGGAADTSLHTPGPSATPGSATAIDKIVDFMALANAMDIETGESGGTVEDVLRTRIKWRPAIPSLSAPHGRAGPAPLRTRTVCRAPSPVSGYGVDGEDRDRDDRRDLGHLHARRRRQGQEGQGAGSLHRQRGDRGRAAPSSRCRICRTEHAS